MELNNVVELILTCTKPEQTDSFRNHEKWFRFCADRFTEKSEQSTVNRKRIKIISIEDKEIRIQLFSERSLGKAPGRALTMLSKMLVTEDDKYIDEYDSFYTDNLFHKKLFKITPVESNAPGITLIEDVDVVKALVDYLVLPKSSIPESKRRAFDEIKRIVIESKILERKEDSEND